MRKDWIRYTLVALVFLVAASMVAAPAASARGGGIGGGMAGGHVGAIGGSMGSGIGQAGRIGGIGGIDGGVGRISNGFDGRGIIGPGHDGFPFRRPGVDINIIGGGGWGGYYPWYDQGYGYSYPYPVYVPVNYGGDPNACFQACVASGQYTPEQCGQMCYQPYSSGYGY